jgi:hypothetical protein
VDEPRDDHSLSTEFRIENRWLSTVRLEPPAWLNASVRVEDGIVVQFSAGLFRAMDIYPTFGASAGMTVESLDTSELKRQRGSGLLRRVFAELE